MLPNVGHQIVHVKIAGIIGAHHILYVSRLRVKFVKRISSLTIGSESSYVDWQLCDS